MCRNIKMLRRTTGIPSDQELHAAAMQFIRKISGYRVPSQPNHEAFEQAVSDVAVVSRALFVNLQVHARATRSRAAAGS